ncbi:MAG: Hsp20/alpha crystallin family protein [Nitrospirae bacterium]|nr:Hsp20/alpha crystallin family protein [Nitrospirota bacterium]
MKLKDLVPWRTGSGNVPVRREDANNPFTALQRQVNDVFNGFFRGFDMDPFFGGGMGFNPSVNVLETDAEIKVTAELPGMDEHDIDVSLTKDTLTLKGQKKEEKEDKGTNYYHMERSYGSFVRTIPLMCAIDDAMVEAEFKKGILTIRLPKTPEAVKDTKKVTIKSE